MADFLQILAFAVIGIVLIWSGYRIFTDQWARLRGKARPARPRQSASRPVDYVGQPKVCLVCGAKLANGELIQTQAFPALGKSPKERQMHVRGCPICLAGRRARKCPVCNARLSVEEKLIARLFDRSASRHHVHILGCDLCRAHKSRPAATVERARRETTLAPARMPAKDK
ncbi:MAG: hypothetical protein FWE09_03435 [Treponema sp.]|nr:hypothetical protein [Treponema sp.]